MAILEFGTRGRIDSDRRKGNRTSRRASGAMEESDGGLAVLAAIAITGQTLGGPVFDTEYGREGDGEPPLGQRRREPEIVRRVGEGEVVRAGFQSIDESERILAMDVHRVARAERIDVRLDGAQAGGCDLDEIGD